jgi:hypothetical protein
LAWFLALHLLQDKKQRHVLMLDDPFGGLDPNNRAAVVATTRAYARLIRPDFFMISTHEEGLGEVLAQELGPVNGWPKSIGMLKLKRQADNSLCVEEFFPAPDQLSFSAELSRLGVSSPVRASPE